VDKNSTVNTSSEVPKTPTSIQKKKKKKLSRREELFKINVRKNSNFVQMGLLSTLFDTKLQIEGNSHCYPLHIIKQSVLIESSLKHANKNKDAVDEVDNFSEQNELTSFTVDHVEKSDRPGRLLVNGENHSSPLHRQSNTLSSLTSSGSFSCESLHGEVLENSHLQNNTSKLPQFTLRAVEGTWSIDVHKCLVQCIVFLPEIGCVAVSSPSPSNTLTFLTIDTLSVIQSLHNECTKVFFFFFFDSLT
jgi:hypothetical protein